MRVSNYRINKVFSLIRLCGNVVIESKKIYVDKLDAARKRLDFK